MGPDPHLLAAFGAGWASLATQVLLLREYLSLYAGNEVALGSFLGAWLLGIALGAWLCGRSAEPGRWAGPAVALQGAAAPAVLVFAAWARRLSGVPPYEPFPLAALLVWAVLLALPCALGTGAAVPALAARARGRSVTAIYVAEALGSLAGGVGCTLWFQAGRGPAGLALAVAALGCGAAAPLGGRGTRRGLAALAGALVLTGGVAGKDASRWLRAQQLASVLPGARLLDWADTPTGTALLGGMAGQRVLLLGGRIVAAFPAPERSAQAAAVLAGLTGGPRRVLLVGARGADVLPGVLDLAGLERVVWVSPDPVFRAFALRHLPGVREDARLDARAGDPVRIVGALAGEAPFDAVWVFAGNPQTRAEARFLTAEVLGALAGLLGPGGVLAVPVESAENYLGPRLRLAVGAAVAAVAAAAGNPVLVPGEAGLVLGRRAGPVPLDPEGAFRAYQGLSPRRPVLSPDGFRSLLQPGRVEDARRLVRELLSDPRVEVPTLDRPVALYRNLLVRASLESPFLAESLERLRAARGWLWIPALVLGLWIGTGVLRQPDRAVRGGTAAAALGAVGGAGLALDLVLLHAYQGRFGTLHGEAGLLFALWMAGLVLGGAAGRALAAARPGRERWIAGGCFGILAAFAGALALGGTAAVVSRPVGAAGFLLGGVLTGAGVPVAEVLLARSGFVGAEAGRRIEAADHLGAAAAALAVGVVAVPLFGIRWAAALAAGAAGFAGVLVLVRKGAGAGRARLRRAYPGWALVLGGMVAASVAGAWTVRLAGGGGARWLSPAELGATGLAGPWRAEEEPVPLHRNGQGAVALASRAAAPRVTGYGGPIDLLVALAPDGTIVRVRLRRHRETPAYLEGSERFFRALEGLSVLRPIRVRTGREGAGGAAQAVDAITGATVTSRAVARALEGVGRALAGPVFGRPFQEGEGGRAPWADPRLWYLAGSWILVWPVLRSRSRLVRSAWLALHAGAGGAWLQVQLSSVQVLALLRGELGWMPSDWTFLLGPAAFVAAVLAGPVYCGGLCPAGAAQELLAGLGLARGVRPEADRRLRFVRLAVFAAVAVAGLCGADGFVRGADLLTRVWSPARGASWIPLAAAGFGSLFVVRFWCRYLCPTGAFLSLGHRWAPLARRLPPRRFRRCDLGIGGPDDPDCLWCFRCRTARAAPRRMLPAPAVALAVGLCLAAGLGSLRPGRPAPGPGVEVRIGRVAPERIRDRIEAGTLSGKRALYWRPLGP